MAVDFQQFVITKLNEHSEEIKSLRNEVSKDIRALGVRLEAVEDSIGLVIEAFSPVMKQNTEHSAQLIDHERRLTRLEASKLTD